MAEHSNVGIVAIGDFGDNPNLNKIDRVISTASLLRESRQIAVIMLYGIMCGKR